VKLKMRANMKVLLASFVLLFLKAAHTKEINYSGEVSFKAETNMPGVSVEGISHSFKTLKADFSENEQVLNKVEAELDAETLKTGIEMRDQHMFEKVFLVLSAKEKPVLLKLKMEKPTCEKKGATIVCSGDAQFTLGKKNITRKMELKFDNKLNTEVNFNLSLKELALEIPGYLGIELEDSIALKMKAVRK
jgi:hypothetical protein